MKHGHVQCCASKGRILDISQPSTPRPTLKDKALDEAFIALLLTKLHNIADVGPQLPIGGSIQFQLEIYPSMGTLF